MKVYVVVENIYEDRDVKGVYATLEAAQKLDTAWEPAGDGAWCNRKDWDDHLHITEYELEE